MRKVASCLPETLLKVSSIKSLSSSILQKYFRIRGHPFMTSMKNDQVFDPPTPTIRNNEQ